MSSSVASAGAESKLAAVHVICGPTAAGKSEVAMWLATQREIELVSADSRQVYRRFDIGTSKPSPHEQNVVAHHAIDVAEPGERFSAARWSRVADAAIGSTFSRRRMPVVVGGTGLYIRTLDEPLWEEPFLDEATRGPLEKALGDLPLAELQRMCRALDPSRAELGRTQLIRAISIALLTGERLSELHRRNARSSSWEPRYLLVDPGTGLSERIVHRASAMFDAGWADEVRRLMADVPANAPAWKSTGYDVVRRHVSGEFDRATARERIVIQTRQYAKRQRTWFRNQLEQSRVQLLDPTTSDWRDRVLRWFDEVGTRTPTEPT